MSTTTAPATVGDDLDVWSAKVERLRKRKPATQTVTVPDEDAEREVEDARLAVAQVRAKVRRELQCELDDERIEAHTDVVAARTVLAEAEAVAADLAVTFTFRHLPPHVYDELQFQHPPTDVQSARGMSYNPETWSPALIAACSVMPITAERVAELMQPDEDGNIAFGHGDVALLIAACRTVNEQPRMNLGKGSRPTRS